LEIIAFSQGCALQKSIYKPPVWCAVHFERQIHVKNLSENSPFHMPNYVLSKGATPMNPHLERTMFTSKSYARFCYEKNISKPGAHSEIWPGRYQFIKHFTGTPKSKL